MLLIKLPASLSARNLDTSSLTLKAKSSGIQDSSGNALLNQSNQAADYTIQIRVVPGDNNLDGQVATDDRSNIGNNGSLLGTTATGSYTAYRDVDKR